MMNLMNTIAAMPPLHRTLWGLLAVSLLLFLGGVVYFAVSFLRKRNRSLNRRMLYFSAFMLGSIWVLRYAVGFYAHAGFNAAEQFFQSAINALQTFSLDSDLSEYLAQAKEMAAALGTPLLQKWIGVYAGVLNVVAPVAGGAILFDVLTEIFPSTLLLTIPFWKKFYYFSELNERSLSLIRSIRAQNSNPFTRPTLICTDVYQNKDDEKKNELVQAAKALGTVCVSDDLSAVPLRKQVGKNRFFLIDEDESECLNTFVNLAEHHSKALRKAYVYLFADTDMYTLVERQIVAVLQDTLKGKSHLMPVIQPIRSYKNLAANLLDSVPLFDPLVGTEKKELNLTVVGSGIIGMELLLAAYWCGQMLDTKLNIRVISKEAQEHFERRLNRINKDILLSARPDSELLRVYEESEEKAAPYFSFCYHQMDMYDDPAMDLLADSDYIVVAMGSDRSNLTAAEHIRRRVAKRRMEEKQQKNTVIAYVVYNSGLCRSMNRKQYGDGIYMHAFGGMDEVFSMENTYFMGSVGWKKMKDLNANRYRDEYNYWSGLARDLHWKYKAYSVGMVNFSVFDKMDEKDRNALKTALKDSYERAARGVVPFEFPNAVNRLTWLEHRRWNAYMRTEGFRRLPDLEACFRKNGHHRDNELKLHACLVECDDLGMRDPSFLTDDGFEGKLDLLDRFCKARVPLTKKYGKTEARTDYKKYDLPIRQFKE